MIKKLLLILFCISTAMLSAQEKKVYFEDAIAKNLRKFNDQSDMAIRNLMPHEVDTIFNSLLNNHLKNTYVSNLKLKKISKGYLETDSIDTPFLLITQSSTIIQTKEVIETINSISELHKETIKIIVIFWDKYDIAKKETRGYNKNITVVYADERYNSLNRALSVYKHSFGVPTCFYINKNKQIYDIDRKFYQKTRSDASKALFAEQANQKILELLASHNDIVAHNDTTEHH